MGDHEDIRLAIVGILRAIWNISVIAAGVYLGLLLYGVAR